MAAVMWAQRRAISSPRGSVSESEPVETGVTGTGAVGTSSLVAGWSGVWKGGAYAVAAAEAMDIVV